MAHHGGRPTPALTLPPSPRPHLPRVHRPVPPPGLPPAAPQIPPRPAPPTPPRPHGPPPGPLGLGPPLSDSVPAQAQAQAQAEVAEVSLATPRPDGERRVNEYVETPVALALRGAAVGVGVRSPVTAATPCRKTVTASPGTPRHHHHRTNGHRQSVNLPVRQQPTTFKKQPPPCPPCGPVPHMSLASAVSPSTPSSSILCAECGRCRCASCREPRPLPSRWLCDDACFCSAETTVDYATCLCCVKGLFYHCGSAGDEGGVWCADDPCSCAGGGSAGGEGSRRCARWSCLALASVALPCLLCYWPLRGLVRATELCYARYCDDGCRCDREERSERRPSPPRAHQSAALLTTPEKRLLETD